MAFSNIFHFSGLQSKSRESEREASLGRLAMTIDNQLRQVLKYLPKRDPGSISKRSYVFRDNVRRRTPNVLTRRLHSYARRSEVVPSDGIIVEVFDQARPAHDVLLKRDEIRRPEVTRGLPGIKLDNVGRTRGNLDSKDGAEQSVTEVIVDDDGNQGAKGDVREDGRTEGDSIGKVPKDKSGNTVDINSRTWGKSDDKNPTGGKRLNDIHHMFDKSFSEGPSLGTYHTKLAVHKSFPQIHENGMESLRSLIMSSKTNIDSDNKHTGENLNVTNVSENNETVNRNNSHHNETYNSSGTDKVRLMTEKSNFTAGNNNSTFDAVTNNNNNSSSSNNNNTNDDNNNNNSSNNNDDNSNNNNNNSRNNNDDNSNNNNSSNINSTDINIKINNITSNINATTKQSDDESEIKELMNTVGSLRTNEKGMSDDQFTKLKETVQDILNLKTVTDVKETKRFGKIFDFRILPSSTLLYPYPTLYYPISTLPYPSLLSSNLYCVLFLN